MKIISGSDEDCYPFGAKGQAGVYVVHVVPEGPGARAGLEIGHRILEINGNMIDPTDKNKIAMALLEAGDSPTTLRIRKHPPPPGFMVLFMLPHFSSIISLACCLPLYCSSASALNFARVFVRSVLTIILSSITSCRL